MSVRCHACDTPLQPGLGCPCQFPRYRCFCGHMGAARTVPDPRAATAAFRVHYMQAHYNKETP